MILGFYVGWCVIYGVLICFCGIVYSFWCIIYWFCYYMDIGESNIIKRYIIFDICLFYFFYVEYVFKIDNMRVGMVDICWFVNVV